MDTDIVALIRAAAAEAYPGLPVVPEMATGATDGAFTRNAGIPTYGVQAVGMDPDDDRAHGTDERLSVAGFQRADRFWYQLLKLL